MPDSYLQPRPALAALGYLGPAERGAHFLARFLDDANPAIRVEATRALGQSGAAAVPLLVEALNHTDVHVRREAATALGKLGAEGRDAVAALADALQDADVKTRLAATTALGGIGGDAAPAIPALVGALRGNHLILGRLAAQALARIGPAAVPALVEQLRATDSYLRREAAWALGEIGPPAAAGAEVPEVPPVTPDCSTSEREKVSTAEISLLRTELEENIRAARQACNHPATATDAVTALTEALHDADPKVSAAAAQALARIKRG